MSVNVERNLGDLDRDICQPLGRILQDAFSYDGGLVSEGAISCGTFAAPIAMTATKTQVLMASSNLAVDPGGAITVRNFWSRAKVSAAQVIGGSVYGSVNQLRIASPTANYAISSAGVYAGAWNIFEASDAAFDVTFTNLKAIGSHAKLEISTNHTISSGSFHGVNIGNAVIPSMASATEFVGLFIEKDGGAQDWKVGIDVNNCTTGIDVGASTTGINLSGAIATGINVVSGGIGIDFNGAFTGSCIQVGDNALHLTTALTSFKAAAIYADTTAVSGTHDALIIDSISGGAGSCTARGIYTKLAIVGNVTGVSWNSPLTARLEIGDADTTTVINNANCFIQAADIRIEDTVGGQTFTAVGDVCVARVWSMMNTSDLHLKNASLLKLQNSGTARWNSAIGVHGNELMDYLFRFSGCGGANPMLGVNTLTPTHGGTIYTIKCRAQDIGDDIYLIASTAPTA